MKQSRGEVLLRIGGAFDVDAAIRIRELVVRAVPGTSFWIDVSDARECHDAAVAILADAATRRRTVKVGVRGLGPHQVRMLRLMGIGGDQAIRTEEDPVAKA